MKSTALPRGEIRFIFFFFHFQKDIHVHTVSYIIVRRSVFFWREFRDFIFIRKSISIYHHEVRSSSLYYNKKVTDHPKSGENINRD